MNTSVTRNDDSGGGGDDNDVDMKDEP